MADLTPKGCTVNPTSGERCPLAGYAAWLGLLLVAVAFAAAAAFSWRKWPDPVIDFGTQLYIPWRLCAGAVLYRDLFYIAGGPLSQYYNAFLFKIFGVSFQTLIFANLTAVALTLLLVYRRFRAVTDTWTATLIGLGIVLVFTFSEYTTIGNYNYIAPYSHEAVHGLMLSILAVTLLSDWVAKRRLAFAGAAGFCAGLVFLTKPDIFVALAVCVAAAFILCRLAGAPGRFIAVSLAALLLAGLVPPAGFFLYFLGVEDWHQSLRSVCFGWLPLLQSDVTSNPFYQWCTGLDEPVYRLRRMLIHFFSLALGLALYSAAFRHVEKLRVRAISSPWVIALTLMVPLLVWANHFDWVTCATSLPLLSLAACVLLGWSCRTSAPGPETVFPLLWSVFGLVLLSKLGLYPRVAHYGFVLAMPAFVGAVYLLFWLLPRRLEAHYAVPSRFLRVAVGLMLLFGYGYLFNASQGFYDFKNLTVGRGGDTIRAFGPFASPATSVKAALTWIDRNVAPDATLAVVPEGITINYLTRHVNPTPCLYWNPVILQVLGQTNMTTAFEQHPPDYVVLVDRNDSEFGVGYFGSYPGYGVDLMQWLGKNYEPVYRVGSEPLQSGAFGVKILKRLPVPPDAKKLN